MSLDIRTIKDGEQITEPGAYRMSLEWYHTQEVCPGPSVSSTGIRKAALQSPHAFWKTWGGNPDRYPEKETPEAFILGRAAHSLILGDEVFDDVFCFVPEDAPRRPTATQVAAFKRTGKWSPAAEEGAIWWAVFDRKNKGKIELRAEQVQRIKWMAENLHANPLAREMLISALVEISMIWQDPVTGIWVKSRPDCIPTNGCDFSDLKTFTPRGGDLVLSCHRAITDYGYALQMALAIEGAEHVFGTSAERCGLVFTQTTEPYEVIPVELDPDALYWARCLNRLGLDRIAHGFKTGEWPGRATEVVTYSYPPSMQHRFAELQLSGDIPSFERAA